MLYDHQKQNTSTDFTMENAVLCARISIDMCTLPSIYMYMYVITWSLKGPMLLIQNH